MAKAKAFLSSNSEAAGIGSSRLWIASQKERNSLVQLKQQISITRRAVSNLNYTKDRTQTKTKKSPKVITNKSGGGCTGGASSFTGSEGGAGAGGGEGGRSSCTSGVFLYSMAKTSFGEAVLLSVACFQ